MTISLEQLADGSLSDRNFQKLMRLVLDTGGVTAGARWGIATLSFTASTDSATLSVTHGLGTTPIVAVATSYNAAAFGKIPNCNTFSYAATTFSLNGEVKTAFTGTATVGWVAIG